MNLDGFYELLNRCQCRACNPEPRRLVSVEQYRRELDRREESKRIWTIHRGTTAKVGGNYSNVAAW